MKFSCEKALLLAAISHVSRIIPSRSSIAALEGILIETNDRLRLTGFNLEVGIRTELDVDVERTGSVVVGARLLGEIVRKLPDETVTFEMRDKLVMNIRCGQSVFDIASCLDGVSYPELPEVSEEQATMLPQALLRGMIHETIFAVSDNENKIIHTGSQFNWGEGKLVIVSVDGYRLALRRESTEGAGFSGSFVVPGVALREIERLLSDKEDETVKLVLGGRHISFFMGDTVLVTRLLEGDFLNYRTAMPASLPVDVRLNIRDFTAGIERVSLLINEKIKNPVRLLVRPGGVDLSCRTSLGFAADACEAEVTGELPEAGIEIGFNHRYLLDALHVLPGESFRLKLLSPLAPCVLMPDEGDAYFYMVLPVRLRAD
ncbi:MAG: DNA polymerase III subunit beta [Oscillospiraceae bacterium]|jgi:DNA polymerase-3 subunit beta|nr:DNA polymerase III subunit beta [Oscillospiraceae bacterium]